MKEEKEKEKLKILHQATAESAEGDEGRDDGSGSKSA